MPRSERLVEVMKLNARVKVTVGVAWFSAFVVMASLGTSLFGPLGEGVFHVLSGLFGAGAWGVPVMLVMAGATLVRGRGLSVLRVLGDVGLVIASATFIQLATGEDGGLLGVFFGESARTVLSTAGAIIMGMGFVGVVVAERFDVKALKRAYAFADSVLSSLVSVPSSSRPLARTESRKVFGGAAVSALPLSRWGGYALARSAGPLEAGAAYAYVDAYAPEPTESHVAVAEVQEETTLPFVTEKAACGFELPSTSLLNYSDSLVEDNGKLGEEATLLVATVGAYDVHIKIEEIVPGPCVTTFAASFEAGTKLSKIVGLADDLSLAFGRKVRVVPSRLGRVGFEVGNAQRAAVGLRELVEDARFAEFASKAALPLVLGRDVRGEPVYSDLAAMPHLIVAGATGSGKSVCVNAALASLLFSRTPEEVRLVLVDPKSVELAPFNGVPHLLWPVVTDVSGAVQTLTWCVEEMERRYEALARAGVKNLASFNGKRGGTSERMPYIVVVIDELADLMMQDKKAVEPLLVRLGQKARASGIHVIVATQRPSVDVVTGLLKANFPSRIGFRVSQAVDSRVVLDEQGAESLLGRGDALCKMADADVLVRVQVPLITEAEIEALTGHFRGQVAS